MKTEMGNWGLNGRRDYIISACTRAKFHLTLIIIGYGHPFENIMSVVESLPRGGTVNYSDVANMSLENIHEYDF